MLIEKLEQESRASNRRRLIFAGGLLGGAFLLGVFLVVVVVVWPAADTSTREAQIVRADGSVVERERATEDVQPQERTDAPTPENQDAARDHFKDAMASFQAEIEPALSAPGFAAWDAEAQRDILAAKDAAFAQFSRGQYEDALNGLTDAADRAAEALRARDAAFDGAMNAARTAYAADSHEQAELEITRARELRPESPEAAALEAEVSRLPEVLRAINKAAVARVENNLAAEDEHLSTALALSPDRAELADRRTEIRSALRERSYADRIGSGLSNVTARNLSGARTDLKAARDLFADRQETRLLSRQIETLSQQLEFERMMAGAAQAQQSDDWVAAEEFYARAGAIVPDDPKVTGGHQLAGEINALRRDLDKVLGTPERLASEAVAGDAAALASKARDLADLSPSLAAQARKVDGLVGAYATKVSVRILSDGVTRITVRGVGQVGATTDRTIQLRPGSYTFEGARTGFRSKLVQVDIPPGTEGLTLEIYPDEPV